jgi:hypothetical protein
MLLKFVWSFANLCLEQSETHSEREFSEEPSSYDEEAEMASGVDEEDLGEWRSGGIFSLC